MKKVISFLFLALLFSTEESVAQSSFKVTGYSYNLYAIKAMRLDPSVPCGDCALKGGVLLDSRKSYQSTYERDEFYLDDRKVFKENEVFKIPGYFKKTTIKKAGIEDYFIAFKLGNKWVNHSYEEILGSYEINAGAEVGCNSCNFSSVLFDDKNLCILVAYYEIKPIFKDGKAPESEELKIDQNVYSKDLSNVDTKSIQFKSQIDQANRNLIAASEKLNEQNEYRSAKTNRLMDSYSHLSSNVKLIQETYSHYIEKIDIISLDNTQFIESSNYMANAYDSFLSEVERISKKKYNKYDSKRKIKAATNAFNKLAQKIPFESRKIAGIESKSIKEIKREMSGEADRIEPIKDRKEISYHILFKVIGDPNKQFDDLKSMGSLHRETYNDNGSTRYLLGDTKNPNSLKHLIKQLNTRGYSASYIVEYKDGTLYKYFEEQGEIEKPKKIVASRSTASIPISSPSITEPNYSIDQIFNDEEFSYHILFRVLGTPDKDFPKLRHIGPLYRETFDAKGTTRYLIGNSVSIEGARKLIKLVKEAGFKSSYIAEYQYGKLTRYID